MVVKNKFTDFAATNEREGEKNEIKN